jgi:hypothetical protein
MRRIPNTQVVPLCGISAEPLEKFHNCLHLFFEKPKHKQVMIRCCHVLGNKMEEAAEDYRLGILNLKNQEILMILQDLPNEKRTMHYIQYLVHTSFPAQIVFIGPCL